MFCDVYLTVFFFSVVLNNCNKKPEANSWLGLNFTVPEFYMELFCIGV